MGPTSGSTPHRSTGALGALPGASDRQTGVGQQQEVHGVEATSYAPSPAQLTPPFHTMGGHDQVDGMDPCYLSTDCDNAFLTFPNNSRGMGHEASEPEFMKIPAKRKSRSMAAKKSLKLSSANLPPCGKTRESSA